jgi:hypothetical protein
MLFSVIRDMFKGASGGRARGGVTRQDSSIDSNSIPTPVTSVARQRAAKVQLTLDGLTQEFETFVDLDDVERNGVAYSQLLRRSFTGRAGWVERLATLINIAAVCRENGLYQDEFAALRMARRMSGGGMELIDRCLAECVAREPVAPTCEGGLRVVQYSSDPTAFERIVGSAAIGNNFVHPGAEFQGLTGVNGQLLIPPATSFDIVSFAIC